MNSREEPFSLREQAPKLIEDVAGFPFGAAEHAAQTLDPPSIWRVSLSKVVGEIP